MSEEDILITKQQGNFPFHFHQDLRLLLPSSLIYHPIQSATYVDNTSNPTKY